MFSGWGKFLSESAERFRQNAVALGHPELGFRVMKVEEGSIADTVGLEEFYDFIMDVNGDRFQLENGLLDEKQLYHHVRNSTRELVFNVFSIKGQTVRPVYMHALSSAESSVGMVVQACRLEPAIENVWHILEVAPHSPAEMATLKEYEDYIVASPEGSMRGEAALGELINDFMGKPLPLYIYNHYTNSTRLIKIVPDKAWGGEGALGCGVGFGALHRIPAPFKEGRPAQPGERLFAASARNSVDSQRTIPPSAASEHHFVPAEMASAEAGALPVARKARRHRPRTQDISDLMRDEEALHRMEDVAAMRVSETAKPPPRDANTANTDSESSPDRAQPLPDGEEGHAVAAVTPQVAQEPLPEPEAPQATEHAPADGEDR